MSDADTFLNITTPKFSALDSVRNMHEEIPILLPGIKVQMDGEGDTYPIEAMQIMRFEGENWKPQGDVIQAPHRC